MYWNSPAVTIDQYKVKCSLLRAACPALDPHVLLFDTGWELLGYSAETSEEPLVRIKHRSYATAERDYKEAYRRLVAAGKL